MEEITFTKNTRNGTVVKKKVPTFRDGNAKEWLQWILRIQEFHNFMGYGFEPEDQAAMAEDLQLLLFDEDLRMLNDIVREEAAFRTDVTIAALKHLTFRHCPPGTRGMLMDDLQQLKKKKGMTVREYSREFRTVLRMVQFLEHGENEPVPEADAVRLYKSGMPIEWQVELNRISRTWDLVSVESQLELIERNERESELLRQRRGNGKDRPQQKGNQRHDGKKSAKNNDHGRQKKYCAYCKRNNHNDNECFVNPESPAYRPRRSMYNTSSAGARHGGGGQRFNRGNDSMAAMQEQITQMAAMMEAMKKRQDDEYAAMQYYDMAAMTTKRVAAGYPHVPMKDEEMRTEVEVEIGSTRVTALIDTGCTKSAIDKTTIRALESEVLLEPEVVPFRNADGSLGQTTHKALATFKMLTFSNTRTCSHTFRVADTLLYPIMLGRDFLRSQKMILDFGGGVMHWGGIDVPMISRSTLVASLAKHRQAAVLASDMECRAEVNLEETEIWPLRKVVQSERLTLEQREELLDLLEEHAELFSGKLGTLKRRPYVLPVRQDAKPFAARPFPIPRAYYDATRKEIQRLVRLGVIEPDTSSPWASPAFVIPKKDGSVRLVCDFRRLNKELVRHYYPVPVIPHVLRSLPKPKYISAFDVPMSYYAQLLARQSRHVTAIVLPIGKFVFNRLPMGVSTAPDEFQAAMDELLGDLDFAWVYLDDILVLSMSFEEHLEHLRIVFERLAAHGVTLHPKKSKVCAEAVDYLGYRISTEGIQAIPNKVEAIQAIAAPRSRRDLRRFVGMVNYYRDMIPRRAELLSPLTRLLSPSCQYKWTDLQERAFQAVKATLAEQTLLAYPEPGKPFNVYTDASRLQLGAVITQTKQPIVFWSKKCNQAQTLYPANRLELLSIVLLLREFRSLLLGQELHLFTDHLNLTYSTFHDIHMMRWRLEIEEFGPIMHYVPGSNNVVADALSRLPTDDGTELEERLVSLTTTNEVEEKRPAPPSMQTLAAREEPTIFNMDMKALARAQQTDDQLVKKEEREIGGVKLFVDKKSKKILVPRALHTELMAMYHEWLIHPGASTMTATMRQVFTWSGMTSDIERYVNGCLACSKAKHPTTKYGKIPIKQAIAWPWFEIAVDSIGPFGKQQFRALSIIDTTTRLIELLPALDGTSREAAFLVDRYWFSRYPRPMRCIYDGGSEFKKEFLELLDSYGIELAPTTVRNPQANAVVERVHRVIGDKMRTKELQTTEDWELFLHNTTFALRAAYHSSIESSPAQQAFGRDMLMDVKHETDWNAEHERKVLQIKRNNQRENSKRSTWDYQPDDMVLLRRDAGVQSKLLPLYDGPYQVIAVQDNGTLTLDRGRYIEKVNMRRVRPCKLQRGGDCKDSEQA